MITNRENLTRHIAEVLHTDPDAPFADSADTHVFRHRSNRKWFAIMMRIPWAKLVPGKEGSVDVMNLKSSPILIGTLLQEAGFYPAWHMNKSQWITAVLDGTAEEETLIPLVSMSYDLTAPKRKRKQYDENDPEA